MKRVFYLGVCLLALFEVANVYFIMPMPFSHRMQTIEVAYVLYRWRWLFRIAFGGMILGGLMPAWRLCPRTRSSGTAGARSIPEPGPTEDESLAARNTRDAAGRRRHAGARWSSGSRTQVMVPAGIGTMAKTPKPIRASARRSSVAG